MQQLDVMLLLGVIGELLFSLLGCYYNGYYHSVNITNNISLVTGVSYILKTDDPLL